MMVSKGLMKWKCFECRDTLVPRMLRNAISAFTRVYDALCLAA
jgi:hypothetical protein